MFWTWIKDGKWKRKLWNTIWMWEAKCWIWNIESARIGKFMLLEIWFVENLWVLQKNVSHVAQCHHALPNRKSLSHIGPMIWHIFVELAYLTPLLRDIWRNRKHSRLYKGCLKIIKKALQKNLESVSVDAKNVGYLKTMKALCIKCKTQSGSKKPSTSKKPKKAFNFDRSCFSKCIGRF